MSNKITFSQKEWDELQKKYTQDQIIKIISDRIVKHNIKFPFRKYTKKELDLDYKSLKELDTSLLIEKGNWFTRFK